MRENKDIPFKENVYGHRKRLSWILSHIRPDEQILEVGCGTGSMISLPLARLGYHVVGADTDSASIAFGKELCDKMNLDPSLLRFEHLSQDSSYPKGIIVSEVLEHLSDHRLFTLLLEIRAKLLYGGLLLVTVPNGYGWFEMESFLWFRTGIGKLLEKSKLLGLMGRVKRLILGAAIELPYPSTLSSSRHRQRFTYRSIQTLLERNGFEVTEITGSVLFCGPFSNLFLTGIAPVMGINCLLGRWFPKVASGFYVACRPSNQGISDGKI